MKNKNYLEKLYRPPLQKTKRNDFICLDKNEPPFSAFEEINNIFNNEDLKELRTYPNPYSLYKKLKKFVNVNINQLLITHGSEQAIEFVFRVFLKKEDEVVFLNPSFAMYDVFTYHAQAKAKYVNFNKNMKLTLERVLKNITKKTKLFVLSNPNNPTGTAFNLNELEKIAIHTQTTNTIFLLDEAYFHFYNIDSISLIKNFDNIFITRTFSKAIGLAGARVGYVISSSDNINLLRKIKPIDEINYLSMKLAEKALDNIDSILSKNILQVKKWKKRFKDKNFSNIQYIETEGNFILLKSNTYRFHKNLFLRNKILPKMDFTQIYLKNYFRLSIVDDLTMDFILNLLTQTSNQIEGWDKKDTLDFYTNNRSSYTQLYPSEKHFINSSFLKTINSILDVGCAVGGMSQVFKNLNRKITYTGLDISQNAIKKAIKLYDNSRTNFYQYDGISEFPIQKQTFDLVFSSGVMHLIDNYEILLNQMIESSNTYILVDFRVTPKQSYTGKFYFDFANKNDSSNAINYHVLNFDFLINIIKRNKYLKKINIYGYQGKSSPMTKGINEVYMLFFKLEKSKVQCKNPKIIFENKELSNIFYKI